MKKHTGKYYEVDLNYQLGKFAVLDFEMHHYHDYSWTDISSEQVRTYSALGYLKQAIEKEYVPDSELLRGIGFWIDRRREAEPLAAKLFRNYVDSTVNIDQILRLNKSEESFLILEIINSDKFFVKLERKNPILFEEVCHEMHRKFAFLRHKNISEF
ncbi:hypothetical protein LPB72_07245 [Hydrogenophaga crassostreae]|uniref:Uncharacterized protein n=1 Tax=Hydrogenophaga crassostreae TaxID=1763535 RepID=A0A162P9H9_9BURK|nr:hypothetical protein [Hydrogenophaga crassostreae]AOW13159.1 hypothetical protein LPB072_10130 [Hydrogenophaga crassostreae]OAD42696.1 hypothetical protein LPB72_07245 [Hydrogenophaga crassostreae]